VAVKKQLTRNGLDELLQGGGVSRIHLSDIGEVFVRRTYSTRNETQHGALEGRRRPAYNQLFPSVTDPANVDGTKAT